jgi:sec-independent protein translocase protein TatA
MFGGIGYPEHLIMGVIFGGIGYQELLIIGVVAILLFGQRLPDVARTWGNSYRDLRRSINDIRASFAVDVNEPPRSRRTVTPEDDRIQESAPRFVPPADEQKTG